MRKILSALSAVALVAVVLAGSVRDADARHGRWVGPAIVGGIATGLLLGHALAGPRYPYGYYYGEPVYVAPGPCYAEEPVWSRRHQTWVLRRVRVPCY